ncbi:hypothetical protein SAMN04487770_12935 [Butyrivibrio sp. ob235]|uniref:hypothetical protein n=1 Tax=Butyrivibrio sp. ob235 TaxID=1761780 RepID=UPI0008C7E056|nr:hypothetical protein [Butyrivibrio sp. ob235]SEM22452.1 hypothetical protein SAMN04487770_12935 [Butyrivibrio sp. ob235]
MTPKEYFVNNFENAIMEIPEEYLAKLMKLSSYDLHVMEAMQTNFPYSNDYSFNMLIESLKEKSVYKIDDSIYVGKVKNPMPNCYTVNNENISGSLICYTTGMSENVNLFAQTLVAIFLGETLGLDRNVVLMYVDLLLFEIERRIHYEYGGKIFTNTYVDLAMELLRNDNIYAILLKGSSCSTVMDSVLILHEYAHYVMGTSIRGTNLEVKKLSIGAVSIYCKLCQEHTEMVTLPKDEIIADIMALLLLTNGYDLNVMEIMSVFIAFLQLSGMSLNDEYTNKHRLKVIHYFFKDSSEYKEYRNEIEYAIRVFTEIIDSASAEMYDEDKLTQGFITVIKSIIDESSLPVAEKYRLINDYVEKDTTSILKCALEESQLESVDSSEFEVF